MRELFTLVFHRDRKRWKDGKYAFSEHNRWVMENHKLQRQNVKCIHTNKKNDFSAVLMIICQATVYRL